MGKNTDYFVKVHNPRQARRVILESTRDVLRVLKDHEDFKDIREKRTHLINQFNNEVGDIKSLIIEMKRLLPKVVVKDVRKPVVEAQKPVKELKKLEQELADIEDKLGSI